MQLQPAEQRDQQLLFVGAEHRSHRALGRKVLGQQAVEQLLAGGSDRDQRHPPVSSAAVAADEALRLERVEDGRDRGARDQKAIRYLMRVNAVGRLAQDHQRVEAGKRKPIAAKATRQGGGDEAVSSDEVDQYLSGSAIHLRKLSLERGRGPDWSVEITPRHRQI